MPCLNRQGVFILVVFFQVFQEIDKFVDCFICNQIVQFVNDILQFLILCQFENRVLCKTRNQFFNFFFYFFVCQQFFDCGFNSKFCNSSFYLSFIFVNILAYAAPLINYLFFRKWGVSTAVISGVFSSITIVSSPISTTFSHRAVKSSMWAITSKPKSSVR